MNNKNLPKWMLGLEMLETLIKGGGEFPEAEYEVTTKLKLSPKDRKRMIEEYDNQGVVNY